MQHKYPFVVLHIEIDGEHVDVNVHPTKMELRFNNEQEVYNSIDMRLLTRDFMRKPGSRMWKSMRLRRQRPGSRRAERLLRRRRKIIQWFSIELLAHSPHRRQKKLFQRRKNAPWTISCRDEERVAAYHAQQNQDAPKEGA